MKRNCRILGLILCAGSCGPHVEACDADALARKAREAVELCPKRAATSGLTCQDRERVLGELAKELGRCSR